MRLVPGLTQADMEKVDNGLTKVQAEELLGMMNQIR